MWMAPDCIIVTHSVAPDSPVSLEVGPDVLGPGEVSEDDLALRLHDLLRLARSVVLPQQRQGVRHR